MYLPQKQKRVIALSILFVVLLLSSIIIVNYIITEEKIIPIDTVPIDARPENYTALMTKTWEEILKTGSTDFAVNDTINPPNIEHQAVFLEISRIRARGIEDVMRQIGLAWRKPPTFYYVLQLHDFEHISDTLQTWDSGYIHREVFRRVENEQETADITISIYERRAIGLLGLRQTQENLAEQIKITYCFRTGRWTGDDYFGDPDGYGCYLGENYEIWFTLRQSDIDGDRIPFWVETNILKTDPWSHDSDRDHDGDGIPTWWEWYWGYDPFTWDDHATLDLDKDGITNIDEYKLSHYLANPYQPAIYIEVDFMKGKSFGPDYVLWEEAMHLVTDKFSQRSYHLTPWSPKITVHFDDGRMGGGGELLPHHGEYIDQDSGIITTYYKNNFADDRKGVFRYVVMAHDAGWAHPQDYKGWYDVICIGASQQFLTKWFRGMNIRPQLQRIVQSIQLMHEIGHTLGLNYYPGIDNASNEAIHYWRNYQSCMNYHWMYRPGFMRLWGKNYGLLLDYSDGSRNEPDRPDTNDWEQIDLRYFKRPVYMEGLMEH
ncbi:MAG: hypothetical protein R6V50_02385 [Thermoplasmatota archaeon]